MSDRSLPSKIGTGGTKGILCLVAVFLFSLPQVVEVQFADPDLWGRLSVGAALFQAGHLPEVDDYSYLAQGARCSHCSS